MNEKKTLDDIYREKLIGWRDNSKLTNGELAKLTRYTNLGTDENPEIADYTLSRTIMGSIPARSEGIINLLKILGALYIAGVLNIDDAKKFLDDIECRMPNDLGWVDVEKAYAAGLEAYQNEPRRNRRPYFILLGVLILLALVVSMGEGFVQSAKKTGDTTATPCPTPLRPSKLTIVSPPTKPQISYAGVVEPPFEYPSNTLAHKFEITGTEVNLSPEDLHEIFELSFGVDRSAVGGDGITSFWMFLPDPDAVQGPQIDNLYTCPLDLIVPYSHGDEPADTEYVVYGDIRLERR